MCIERIFKPTDEFIEDVKKKNYIFKDDKLNDIIIEIKMFCMKYEDTEYSKHIFILKNLLSYVCQYIKSNTYKYIINEYEREKTIVLCVDYIKGDVDEVTKHTLERLMMYKAVIKTPDFYNNSEEFNIKYEDISIIIQDFIDSIYDIYYTEIAEKLKQYEVTNTLEDF